MVSINRIAAGDETIVVVVVDGKPNYQAIRGLSADLVYVTRRTPINDVLMRELTVITNRPTKHGRIVLQN